MMFELAAFMHCCARVVSQAGYRNLEAVAWGVTAAIVAIDARLAPGYAAGVLYVGVMLAGLWIPRRTFTIQYAVAATALDLLGLVTPWVGGSTSMGMFNRTMSIGALWVTAMGIRLYLREADARFAAETRLRQQAGFVELGKMAGAVAHEVRNALAGIGSAFQLLHDSGSDDAAEDNIRLSISQRLEAVTDTVTDLLMFVETRPQRLAPVRVKDLVDDAIGMVRRRPDGAQVSLRVDVPDISVRADREYLARALFNVILNAAQVMPASGEISVRAWVTADRWRIEVVDQGPGLSQAAREHLFEPFFSTKSRGVGVGLAFARRVVHSHGGTIDLRCPPEGGTTVALDLPIEPDNATEDRNGPPRPQNENRNPTWASRLPFASAAERIAGRVRPAPTGRASVEP